MVLPLPPVALSRISAGNGYTDGKAAEWEKVPANAKTVQVVEDFDKTRFMAHGVYRNGYPVAEATSGKESSSLPARGASSRDLSVEVAIRNSPRTTASGQLELQI